MYNKINKASNRSLSLYKSGVSWIFNQWLELKTFDCYTAQMLYEMYNNDLNYPYIRFLLAKLSEVYYNI